MNTKLLLAIGIMVVLSMAACAPLENQPGSAVPTATECPTPEGAVSAMCALNSPVGEGTAPVEPTAGAGMGGQAQGPGAVPPRNEGKQAWNRVTVEEAPFSFELPTGWVQSGSDLVWIPAGVVPENGPRSFGIKTAKIEAGQEPEAAVLPANSVVEHFTAVQVMGKEGKKYQLETCEGENCSMKLYMTIFTWPTEENMMAAIYVQAPTVEERTALEAILERAVNSLQ